MSEKKRGKNIEAIETYEEYIEASRESFQKMVTED